MAADTPLSAMPAPAEHALVLLDLAMLCIADLTGSEVDDDDRARGNRTVDRIVDFFKANPRPWHSPPASPAPTEQAAAVVPASERELFEREMAMREWCSGHRNEDGEYESPAWRAAWFGWQLRAGLSAPVKPDADDDALPSLRSLVRTILTNAHAFEWSLQGMGMLRLHLPGAYRLHVWDSRYRVPNVSMIHDHLQWGLHSTIIAGELTNRRYVMAAEGEPYMFGTLKPGQGCYFKDDPRACHLRPLRAITYGPGGEYEQDPAEIHQSDPLDGTVTLMHKRPTADESARVFWPAGEQWVSAEPRRATPEEVAAITGYALDRWFGGSAPATSASTQSPTPDQMTLERDAALPPAYMQAKLSMVMPLFQEARDALCAITEPQRIARGISPTLADRMDAAGYYSLDDWTAAQQAGKEQQ